MKTVRQHINRCTGMTGGMRLELWQKMQQCESDTRRLIVNRILDGTDEDIWIAIYSNIHNRC